MDKAIILITGAGSGIGKLSARSLALAGHTVYATMRDVAGRNKGRAIEARDWARTHGADLRPLELDVLSQASCDAAVAAVVAEQGRLDVVVQNAGQLVVGPVEAFTAEEVAQVLDTNFLGAQRVLRAALPRLRSQEAGLLLWISSTTTKGGFPPFLGPYGAAKAAMDSLAVSLSYEVTRFGIETAIMVPGAFTRGTEHFPSAGKPAEGGAIRMAGAAGAESVAATSHGEASARKKAARRGRFMAMGRRGPGRCVSTRLRGRERCRCSWTVRFPKAWRTGFRCGCCRR